MPIHNLLQLFKGWLDFRFGFQSRFRLHRKDQVIAKDKEVELCLEKSIERFLRRANNRLAANVERSVEQNGNATERGEFVQQFPKPRVLLFGNGLHSR